MATTPVLTLATRTEYPTVEIDGHKYALLPADALPVDAYQRFEALTTRFDALWKTKQRTADEKAELATVLDDLCRTFLQAPPEVHEKLTDIQRLQITMAFLELPQTGLQGLRQRSSILKRKTGKKTRRASSASTAAAIPRPGSRGFRSGRSART